jgi:hypothetical protein
MSVYPPKDYALDAIVRDMIELVRRENFIG